MSNEKVGQLNFREENPAKKRGADYHPALLTLV